MLRGLFCLPVFLWLLMPPGICLCHLPETILARLMPSRFPPPAPHDDEAEHPPGCTFRKLPFVEESPVDPGQFTGPLPGLLLPAVEIMLLDPLPGSPLPSPIDSGHAPLYLTTLALRL